VKTFPTTPSDEAGSKANQSRVKLANPLAMGGGASRLLAVCAWVYIALLHAMGIISQPILGYLSDRLGRKAVLFPSFITLGILFAFLRTVAPVIPLAFVVAAIGLFFYTLLNITFAAAMDVAGSKLQATSYGLSSLMMQLATSPTPIVAGWLIGKYGIGSAFLLAGFLTLIGGLLLSPLRLYRGTRARSLNK
jgi:MFS family permease